MDDLHWIWETILIFYIGKVILRIGGRKSISQMSINQVIVMIGIGSLLIQPVADKSLFHTFAVAFLITILMVVTEYVEVKFDILETISTGKAKVVIEDGQLNITNLKKIRMSVDQLETRLRQSGVSSIDDIKYATVEVSGQLGYELKEAKKLATKADLNLLMDEIAQLQKALGINIKSQTKEEQANNIFDEVKNKNFEGKDEP
ncbi:DUF421 domain-containing protein [Amphibacillus sp. Q70]|uniref:DUF421 domain-containing protein n=1 Tax=Amphibacillus sp. Q70 TaxID=3453416 RepID=UPI003F85B677